MRVRGDHVAKGVNNHTPLIPYTSSPWNLMIPCGFSGVFQLLSGCPSSYSGSLWTSVCLQFPNSLSKHRNENITLNMQNTEMYLLILYHFFYSIAHGISDFYFKYAVFIYILLMYRKTSSISRTKFQNLNVSCILLQLSSLNPLKPGVKLRMKM